MAVIRWKSKESYSCFQLQHVSTKVIKAKFSWVKYWQQPVNLYQKFKTKDNYHSFIKYGYVTYFHIFNAFHFLSGRVAMSDPNLQSIPKDFEIQMPSIIGESPPQGTAPAISCLNAPTPLTRGRGRRGAAGRGGVQQKAQMGNGSQEPSFAVSVRHAFCPFPGMYGCSCWVYCVLRNQNLKEKFKWCATKNTKKRTVTLFACDHVTLAVDFGSCVGSEWEMLNIWIWC